MIFIIETGIGLSDGGISIHVRGQYIDFIGKHKEQSEYSLKCRSI